MRVGLPSLPLCSATTGPMKTLIIDNYDSFTINLYQLLAELNGGEPPVSGSQRSGGVAAPRGVGLRQRRRLPGPGRPEAPDDVGVARAAISESDLPILGVCLGHQAIGHAFGANVVHAPRGMHGRASPVYHDGAGLFDGVPQGFSAVRYHSLVVDVGLPACLQRTAWTADGVLMGLRHRSRPLWGVQFHPESICTEQGRTILANFRALTAAWWRARPPLRRERILDLGGARTLSAVPGGLSPNDQRGVFEVTSERIEGWADPEAVFAELYARDPHAFWLDSSLAEEGQARFSFMGGSDGPHAARVSYRSKERVLTVCRAGRSFRHRESLFAYLERQVARHRPIHAPPLPFDFLGGYVGYLGYEMKGECGADYVHVSPDPDAQFLLADRLLAFDHLERVVTMVQLVRCDGDDAAGAGAWFAAVRRRIRGLRARSGVEWLPGGGPAWPAVEFHLHRGREEYLEGIARCLEAIGDGESYELCLTNEARARTRVDPFAMYSALRRRNPAPYAAFLRFGPELSVACSSPERFLRIDRHGDVESKPIKGTRPRGATPEEDARLREALRSSEKDRAENLMIVDLLRNDLGTVCEVGSVHVPVLMDVESYATVHQLVSTVRGHLRPGMSAVDCVRHPIPGGP